MTGNGAVPASQLTTVQDPTAQWPIQLENNTASAWYAMKNAAASVGVALTIATPAGGYRSLALQQAMINDPAAFNVTASMAPVGSSTHGYGTCLDIGTTTGNNWAAAHCAAYGFVRDRLQYTGEANHYHYTGATTVVPSSATQEDLMGNYYLRYTSSNPNKWIAVNDIEKTYRIIPPGAFESQRLDTLDTLGLLPQINIADPVWGATYGNGQFTSIP